MGWELVHLFFYGVRVYSIGDIDLHTYKLDPGYVRPADFVHMN